jgi:hypothetical protein
VRQQRDECAGEPCVGQRTGVVFVDKYRVTLKLHKAESEGSCALDKGEKAPFE